MRLEDHSATLQQAFDVLLDYYKKFIKLDDFNNECVVLSDTECIYNDNLKDFELKNGDFIKLNYDDSVHIFDRTRDLIKDRMRAELERLDKIIECL